MLHTYVCWHSVYACVVYACGVCVWCMCVVYACGVCVGGYVVYVNMWISSQTVSTSQNTPTLVRAVCSNWVTNMRSGQPIRFHIWKGLRDRQPANPLPSRWPQNTHTHTHTLSPAPATLHSHPLYTLMETGFLIDAHLPFGCHGPGPPRPGLLGSVAMATSVAVATVLARLRCTGFVCCFLPLSFLEMAE